MSNGFARTYHVSLLFDRVPEIKKADLLASLRRHCGTVEPLDGNPDSDSLLFMYPDYPVSYGEQAVPAQSMMNILESGISVEKMEETLQQTWDWPEARSVVARCQATMLVSDFMSSGLEYKTRLALFHKIVLAVLEVTPCIAMEWLSSLQFVNPAAYRESKQPDGFDPLFPAMNVRLFNINNGAEGETLMDTVGLAALGVPDVQCHFVGLDVNEMVRVLYNTGYYLFEKGDVINDGETVQGVVPADHWKCQHEMALVAPEREVLDINPGRPYAAGNRR